MQRLTRLDGLRGVLAVYIMVCHALPYSPAPKLLAALFNHGEAMVDLFFALSGLVVINSLERFNYRFRPFIAGRARRLLPVYFCVLALAVLLEYAGSPLPFLPWLSPDSMAGSFWAKSDAATYPWHILAHVFMLHGVVPHGVSHWVWITVLGPAWSLSTEWQFYLLMALAVPRLRGPHCLGRFAFLMLGIGLLYRALLPELPPFWTFSRAFLPDAAPYFALGLASAVWLRGGSVRPYLLCLGVAFGLGLVSGVPSKALICLTWTVVLLAQRHPRMPVLPALLDSRIAQYLAAISYPLYLINEPVQRAWAMLVAPLSHGDPAIFCRLWLPAAITLPIAAAMALHHWVERPALRPRRLAWRDYPSLLEPGRRIFTR